MTSSAFLPFICSLHQPGLRSWGQAKTPEVEDSEVGEILVFKYTEIHIHTQSPEIDWRPAQDVQRLSPKVSWD